MALPLITPTLQVSPQGGGTLTSTATTRGRIPNRTYTDSDYQDYRYTATPATGYRFVRFDIEGTYDYTDHRTGETTTSTRTYSTPDGTNPFESVMRTEYSAFYHPACGATYWWERYNGKYEEYLTQLVVTAVFERMQDGDMLLFDDNNTQRLIYDDGPNNTGLLVYGGTLP